MTTATSANAAFSPIERLLRISGAYDDKKADVQTTAHECHFTKDGRILIPKRPKQVPSLATAFFSTMPSGDRMEWLPTPIKTEGLDGLAQTSFPFTITKQAKSQLVAKLFEHKSNPLARGSIYLRHPHLPNELFGKNMEYWREHYRGRNPEWLVRIYESTVRGVLTAGYPIFQNSTFLQTVNEFSQDLIYRVKRSYVDADSMYVKMLWSPQNTGFNSPYWDTKHPDSHPYQVGVACVNNEIGGGKIKILPLIQRTLCDNSIVVAGEGWEQSHNLRSGREGFETPVEYIRAEVKLNLTLVFATSQELLDEILRAETDAIPSPAEAIQALSRSRGYSEEVRNLIFIGTELEDPAQPSHRMSIVNGLSSAGKVMAQRGNHAAAYGLETAAGTVLTQPDELDRWIRDGLARKREREEAEFEIL